jgi:hypothetical protein
MTTAGDATATLPSAWRSRVQHSLVVPTVMVLAIAAAFVGLRLADVAGGDVTKFVVAGSTFTDPARAPDGLAVLPSVGYDGNFYYRLALDPLNFNDTDFGITIQGDQQLRRDRILYPAVVHVIALGSVDAVPWTMVAVNVLAMAAIALFGAALARSTGRRPLWGLLFVAFPLLWFSLARDLTELLEVALVLAALLGIRNKRWGWVTVALTAAVLTRETAVLVVAGLAADRVVGWARRRERPSTPDLAWAIPLAALMAWQLVIRAEVGRFGFTGGSGGMNAPFWGLQKFLEHSYDLARTGALPGLLQDAEAGVLVLVVALAVISLRSTTAPSSEQWALVLLTLFAASLLSAGSWLEEGGLRAFADLYVVAVLVAMSSKRRLAVPVAIAAGTSFAAMVQLVRFI